MSLYLQENDICLAGTGVKVKILPIPNDFRIKHQISARLVFQGIRMDDFKTVHAHYEINGRADYPGKFDIIKVLERSYQHYYLEE